MTATRKKISPYGSIKFKSPDEYHASFPINVQEILQQLRQTIKQVAPQATEIISYNIPAFKNVVSYAAYKKHIGFYAGASALTVFKEDVKKFKTSKGTIQFPIDKPLPIALIKKIVRFRVAKDLEKAKTKKEKTTAIKGKPMNKDIQVYNDAQSNEDRKICNLLALEISRNLPEAENKIWHAHPVWFLDGNPIVGYSKLKDSVRLLFWSGQSFDEDALQKEGTFKAAEVRYTSVEQISTKDLSRWLKKSKEIQWDYKNLIKRKGVMERLK